MHVEISLIQAKCGDEEIRVKKKNPLVTTVITNALKIGEIPLLFTNRIRIL